MRKAGCLFAFACLVSRKIKKSAPGNAYLAGTLLGGVISLESLRHYLRKQQKEELGTAKPLGWKNDGRIVA
jgi:hypothetical protein